MTPFLLALMHKICYDDGKEMRGLMLEIRYKKIHKEKTKEATETSLYIKNKEPLLIKGSSEDIAALFHCILKDAQVEFYLGSQNLDTSLVRTSIVHLKDSHRDYARISVREYLSRYVPNETLDTFLQRLELKDKQDCYLHEISSDDRLLIKAALAFFQQPYMLCIEGNWNLCGEAVQNKLHHMMCAYLQKGGYVILANTASCFYDCQEEYDLQEELPQEKPMENFLDEDLPFIQRKVMPKFKKKHWYESRIIQVVKYSCYALLCFCISSIFVGWLLNTQGIQKQYQDKLDGFEEAKRYPLEIDGFIDHKGNYNELDEECYKKLEGLLSGYEWQPEQYFSLNLNGDNDSTYIYNEQGILPPGDLLIEHGTRGSVYTNKNDFKDNIVEDYDIPGVYITQDMVKHLVAENISLKGYSIHMLVYIPLYTGVSINGVYDMGTLSQGWEVEVPIAGILSKNPMYNAFVYTGENYELLMDASTFEAIRNQQQPNLEFNERQDMEAFGVNKNIAESRKIVRYIPRTVRVYAKSLAEASQLGFTLSDYNNQFQIRNLGLSLKNQMQSCVETVKLIQDATISYVLIAILILLIISFLLRLRQRRHFEEIFETYASAKEWKRHLLFKMMLTMVMISVSVWFLYAHVFTFGRMAQLSMYMYTYFMPNSAFDLSELAFVLLEIPQMVLFISEVPQFYVVVILLSTCISLCIFAPEYIKYLRIQHKQRIVTKKIS